ncbi:hypothetical protein ACFWJS_33645 [Streptomyces sp. NPDC127061]|uniref:phage tail protein n=1 Tax=Streptomyces sp. NPDC127061 TaxID=3347122 RepID=UPI003650C21C
MAGSPGGREVARLSVKVLPDTSKFGSDLQRFLDRIEARAKVAVKVVPDTRQFAADLRTDLARVSAELKVDVRPDVRRFRAELRAMLDRLRVVKKVEIEPDTSGFSAKLTTRLAAIRERVKVAADPDLSRFRIDLQRRLARIRAELKVRIKPDLRAFRAEVTALVRGLRIRPITVLIRPTLDMRAYSRVRARLRALGRPITVRVRTVGDRIPNPGGGGGAGSVGDGGGSAAGGAAASIARLAVAVGSVLPQLSSLIASLIQTGPALGVMATGLLAAASAGGALAIGMKGVGDALAGDEKALARLTPQAAYFVQSVRSLAPEWKTLRLDVQANLFRKLGDAVKDTAKVALPVLRKRLSETATTLNGMGKGVLSAVRSLAKGGALDEALKSSNAGLKNLSQLPAVIVQGLVQVGAAAGPAFDRLTKRAGGALDRLSERMSKAFKNGSMEGAIERAIDVAGQFVDVGKNIGAILKNIFGAAATAGGSFLDTLQRVTGEFAKLTAAPEVQSGLVQLFRTLAQVSSTAVGILGGAFRAIAPAIDVLGPPVQRLVRLFGESLKPVFKALQPVLTAAAEAIGALLDAVGPLLPVIGELVASLLPAVTPLFAALKDIFVGLKPVVAEVAGILRDVLKPVFDGLSVAIKPLAEMIADQLVIGLGFLRDLLVELKPSLVLVGEAFGELLAACGPLIEAWSKLSMTLLTALAPAMKPIIKLVGTLVDFFAGDLARSITDVAVPAIESLTALLSGDFDTAMKKAKQAAQGFIDNLKQRFTELPSKIAAAMDRLVIVLRQKAGEAGAQLLLALVRKRDEVVVKISELPDRARRALGNLGGTLVGAGQDLINGFVIGIASKIQAVQQKLQDLTSKLPDWKGPKKRDAKILTPAGRSLIEGFIKGIDDSTAKLKSRLQSITKALPANVRSGYGKTLKRATNELDKLVKKRDGVIKKLAAAEKKLADLTKARSDVKKGVVSGILGDADLTKMTDESSSIQGLTRRLKDYAAQAVKFAADIQKLKKRGLDADIIRQIADAGVTGGSATADLLSRASAGQIKELNKAQATLEKAAGKAGDTAADALYKAGIQSAKGLVKGLESQQSAIEKQMVKIAKSMQKAIKKALGIHSPARKLIPVGQNTTLGVLKGVEDKRPELDRVMASLVAVPSVSAAGVSADVASSLAGPGLDGSRLALVLADGTQLDAYMDTRVSGGINQVRRRQRAGKKW